MAEFVPLDAAGGDNPLVIGIVNAGQDANISEVLQVIVMDMHVSSFRADHGGPFERTSHIGEAVGVDSRVPGKHI